MCHPGTLQWIGTTAGSHRPFPRMTSTLNSPASSGPRPEMSTYLQVKSVFKSFLLNYANVMRIFAIQLSSLNIPLWKSPSLCTGDSNHYQALSTRYRYYGDSFFCPFRAISQNSVNIIILWLRYSIQPTISSKPIETWYLMILPKFSDIPKGTLDYKSNSSCSSPSKADMQKNPERYKWVLI